MSNKIEVIAIDKDLKILESCVIETVHLFTDALPLAKELFDAKDESINKKACGYISTALYPIMGCNKNTYS